MSVGFRNVPRVCMCVHTRVCFACAHRFPYTNTTNFPPPPAACPPPPPSHIPLSLVYTCSFVYFQCVPHTPHPPTSRAAVRDVRREAQQRQKDAEEGEYTDKTKYPFQPTLITKVRR